MWCCYRTNISHAAITNNSVLAKWLWGRVQLQSWKVLLRRKCSFTIQLTILKMFDRIVQQSLAQFFNSHWHDCSTVAGMIVQQSLAWLFNSHWQDCSTVAGTIIQQSLARLFNSRWHGYSTAAGTIIQQSLAQLFNSHWHNYSAVADTILQQYFFLLQQNSSTVMFTVEKLCHVPGIRHMIQKRNIVWTSGL